MARPVQSNVALHVAFHRLSCRYALATMSIGIAVITRTSGATYAVAAASVARVAAMVPAGAEVARPITVSWVMPIASGSRRGGGALMARPVAGWSVMLICSI